MIDYSNSRLEKLVVHHIGSRAAGEPLRLSKTPVQLSEDDDITFLLIQYFFRSFNTGAFFNFTHDDGLEHNQVYQIVKHVFEEKFTVYDASVDLAKLLFEVSNHPKIRGGEFYVAQFSNVVVDGEPVSAFGIFKSENKETFLKVMLKDQNFEIGAQEGINIKKLDKGCIIFSTEAEMGFKICSIDNINKCDEAKFWKDDFLGLQPREDNYYHTHNYLDLCKGFVKDVFNEKNDVPKPDQIDILNRSIGFFDSKANFKEEDFEREVMRQPDVIDAFKEYKDFFAQEKNIDLRGDFDISKEAVKSDKKYFKSILKLDKNFHIYVHGKRDLMERGFDRDKGMNYYKMYFDIEL